MHVMGWRESGEVAVDTATMILRVVIGVLLLLLGRQVFWMAVGLLGFLVTSDIVAEAVQIQPEWLILVLALVVGLLGALIAVFLQRLAAGIGGFLAGVYLVFGLFQLFGIAGATLVSWLFAIFGGVIGAVLGVLLFDWAIIILTALSGASLLVELPMIDPPLSFVLFVVAAAVGIVVQFRLMERSEPTYV
jgi:hypothetical protein